MSTRCPHCSCEFPGEKLNARHLAKCNPSLTQKTPPCLCGHEATSATQMKRHRQDCLTWQARDRQAVQRARVEATSLKRYGVTDASQAPAVQARREATNKERYGATNPFCKEATTFDKVQVSLGGKRPVLRGEDNAFAKPEVKAKIRQHWQRTHGVAGPQQVPAIRAKTKTTNEERYGGELRGSPELRAKGDKTNLTKYGTTEPSRTPEVQAHIQETNLKRYGVPWTSMVPEVRQKQLGAMEARYGAHYFASDEGKAGVRAVLMETYGVEFPGAIEGHWEKVVATFQERYGVDHPLQLPEVLARARETCIVRYGTPFPGLCLKGPNKLEQKVLDLCPSLLFTGNGKFWKRLPALGAYKNPDFILPGPDPEHPKRGVKKVVEAFGDFWHSRMFTGKANWAHEQELIDAYAEIGISCLIVWESEVKADSEEVRARLAGFLSPPQGYRWGAEQRTGDAR